MGTQQKASDAILGQLVTVSIQGPAGPEPVGEFDKGDWKVIDEVKHRKPLGFKLRRNKLLIHGFEGSFERGKIDKEIIQAVMKEWDAVVKGEMEPRYIIDITNTYYDGTEETHRFRESILHDFNWMSNGADEFVEEKIKFTSEDHQLENV